MEKELARQRIASINLEPIKFNLVRNEGWSLTLADTVEPLYRGFLLMKFLHPDQIFVVTRAIDVMWHNHVLDTEKYAEDCMNVFGRSLPHYPYLGLRGEEDRQRRDRLFDESQKLFQDEFGYGMNIRTEELSFLGIQSENVTLNNLVCCGCGDITDRPDREDTLALVREMAIEAANQRRAAVA